MRLRLTITVALGLTCVLGLAGCGLPRGGSDGGLSNSTGDAAGDYPTGPIELVVPFDPGGGADFAGRVVARHLEQEVGEAVTVVNIPGAGGQIGATELATSPPDGQVVGLISAGILLTLPTIRDTAYDLGSFEVIGKIAVSRQVVQIQADAPWRTADELVAYARQNPGQLTYGTSGVGSTAHLAMALFLQEAGVEAEHVVYDGLGTARTDLMGGNIDAVVGPVTDSGETRIRPLVSLSAERGSGSPDVALVTESGYRTAMDVVHYVVAPAGTPRPALDALETALGAVANDPEAVGAFGASELELSFSDSVTSDQELQAYEKVTNDVVADLGIQER